MMDEETIAAMRFADGQEDEEIHQGHGLKLDLKWRNGNFILAYPSWSRSTVAGKPIDAQNFLYGFNVKVLNGVEI